MGVRLMPVLRLVVALPGAGLASPGPGALTVSGPPPTVAVTAHQFPAPGIGALTLVGPAPSAVLSGNAIASPGVGAMLLAGPAPTADVSGNQADPTQLPLVTTQEPDLTAYNALGVPAMAAGEAFSDPTSAAICIKLTDSTFPFSGIDKFPPYSEGSFYTSREFTKAWPGLGGATKRTVRCMIYGSTTVEVNTEATDGSAGNVQNARSIPGMKNAEGGFSPVLGEEHIVYFIDDGTPKQIRRYNVETQAFAEAGTNFPLNLSINGLSNPEWFQWDKNARYFICMQSGGQATLWWDSVTDTVLTHDWGTDIDEPHIDRETGMYVLGVVPERVWRIATDDEVAVATKPDGNLNFAHAGAPAGKWTAASIAGGGVTPTYFYDPSTATWTFVADFGAYQPDHHTSGQWMQAEADTEWTTGSWFCNTCAWSGNDGPDRANVFFRKNGTSTGEVRLLCHSYSWQPGNYRETYWSQPHGSVAIQGTGMLYGSNQNNSSNINAFFCVTPRS